MDKNLKENPVLPNQGVRDFRDPKVSQVVNAEGEKEWVMTLAVQDRIQFYSSTDLKSWSKIGEFGQNTGAHGGVWECPDLLRMQAPDGTEKMGFAGKYQSRWTAKRICYPIFYRGLC